MGERFLPAAHWHVLTPLYEGMSRPFAGRIWRRVAQEIVDRTPPGAAVVDLGCGPGTVLRLLRGRRSDLRLSGLDIDPRMAALARRKCAGHAIEILPAPINALPLPDRSMDGVVSSLVFHHLDETTKRRALAEVARVLRPGGFFLLCDFSVPTRGWVGTLVSALLRSEPEVGLQVGGQLVRMAKEEGATVETLDTLYGCIALHLLTFRLVGAKAVGS